MSEEAIVLGNEVEAAYELINPQYMYVPGPPCCPAAVDYWSLI